jgi:hypothetical protein
MEPDIGAVLSKEMFFSGTQVNYFVVCKTKLSKNIVIYHRGERRVRRVLGLTVSIVA